MTRVWLTGWEWACCGRAFAVGDDVDFGIVTQAPHPALAEALGRVLVATVDAIESHHEGEFDDRVRGRVVAVHAVTREVIERRSLHHPGHGAPPATVMPSDGEEWPVIGRELGNGVFMESRPSRHVIEIVPIAGTAVLLPARGVRLSPIEQDETLPTIEELTSDPPPEWRVRSLAGWLIDIEEQ
ncbi:DUF6578 domain-containing protein [Glaciibacter sp. 2TAF33]|uniref:DUF6578 domain-containing protein n=1 Tax=Glaciibacter sp. 2TAF33 TaxID=3233015 RepID=UPI003F8E3AD9